MATAAANGSAGVTALTASENVLSYFWDLASLDQAVRDKAASSLVEELVISQRQFEQQSELESEDDAAAAAGGSGKGAKGRAVAQALRRCSPLMTYAVKRLVKGLGSGRQGARQGFALALTLVLGQAGGCLSAQGAAAVVASVLEAAGAGKGGEARDILLGQVFGLGAIVRSGQHLDAAAARDIAAALVHIADKKSFLKEVAVAVLLELAERVDDTVLADVARSVGPLRAWLTAPAASAMPEALLLAVRLWGRLPADVVAACPLLPAGGVSPPPPSLFTAPTVAAGKAAGPAAAALLGARHLAELVPVLRETSRSHPRLHSVWPTLLALLIPGFNPDKEQRQSESGQNAAPRAAELEALWGVVVERELFTSSHERKYLGFMLFAILLPHLKSEHVALVFTPNFLRCLSNNLAKQDSYLHATAKKCLERITAFAEKADAGTRVAVTLALKRHGGAGFDKLTKAKKAGSMLEGMGGEALKAQIVQLQQAFEAAAGPGGAEEAGGEGGKEEGGEEGEEEAAAAAHAAPPQQQQWAVEQLCALCKLPAAGVEERRTVLHFLALHAFVRLDPKATAKAKDKQLRESAQCSAGLAPAARRLCAARLISLADALSRHPGKGSQQQQQQQKGAAKQQQPPPQQQQQQEAAVQRHDYLPDVVGYVERVARSPGAALLADEASEAAEQALAALRTLRTAAAARLAAGTGAGEEAGRLRALGHLAGQLALGVLGDPEAADPGAAQDLEAVYRVVFEGADAPQAQGEEEGAPSHWMDTLMDVLLSLLARTSPTLPSAPLRDAVEQAFRAFAADLTPTGMQDMLRIIGKPVEGGKGEEGIFESDEDEEEGEEGGEGTDGEGGSESEKEEEAAGSGSDEEGEAAAQAGGSDSGSQDESEDEEGASDEAMFRMDTKLAAYFAAAQESRRSAKAQREELLNFKMRVTALLEAFIKKMPGSPLLPSAVVPLLTALAASSGGGGGGVQTALAQRLAGLIQHKLCKSKPEASGAAGGPAGEEELAVALRRCLYLASRPADKQLLAAAAAAYQYLLRVAAGMAGGVAKHAKARESVLAALADLLTKKRTRLGRSLFEAMMRPPLALAPLLVPALLGHAARARSDFVRAEALGLLAAALKARSPEVDAAVGGAAEAAGALLLDAVARPQAKPARQAEALRAVVALLESLHRGGGGLGAAAARKAAAGVGAALESEPAPKLAAQLERLAELLREGSGDGGGEQQAAATAKGTAKPKKATKKPQPQQGGSPGKRKPAAAVAAGGKEAEAKKARK